jgi:hypothetical protein
MYRRLQFKECSQDFVGTHNEMLSVAMRVHNPNRLPFNDPELRPAVLVFQAGVRFSHYRSASESFLIAG